MTVNDFNSSLILKIFFMYYFKAKPWIFWTWILLGIFQRPFIQCLTTQWFV